MREPEARRKFLKDLLSQIKKHNTQLTLLSQGFVGRGKRGSGLFYEMQELRVDLYLAKFAAQEILKATT